MKDMDYSMLRAKIRTYFGNEKNFVAELQKNGFEMSTGAFSNKINCKSSFTQEEMIEICSLLKIKMQDIPKYFFTKKYELNS